MAHHGPKVSAGDHLGSDGMPTFEHHGDHGGLGKYIAVFIALCVLTSFSFMTYFPFWREKFPPQVGWSFMLAVACCKAMLVILFFMHVKYEANWKYVLTIPAALMAVFLMVMLVPDIGMRVHGWGDFSARYSSQRLLYAADEEDVKLLQEAQAHAEH